MGDSPDETLQASIASAGNVLKFVRKKKDEGEDFNSVIVTDASDSEIAKIIVGDISSDFKWPTKIVLPDGTLVTELHRTDKRSWEKLKGSAGPAYNETLCRPRRSFFKNYIKAQKTRYELIFEDKQIMAVQGPNQSWAPPFIVLTLGFGAFIAACITARGLLYHIEKGAGNEAVRVGEIRAIGWTGYKVITDDVEVMRGMFNVIASLSLAGDREAEISRNAPPPVF